jgi:hypothetical protein
MYFILSKLVEEISKVRQIDLHGMRFSISDHKAFTSVGKMYTLANVWTESGLGWRDSMKRNRRTWHNISTKLRTMKIYVPRLQTWG